MNRPLKIGDYLEDITGVYEITDIDAHYGLVFCRELIQDDDGNTMLDKIERRLTIAEALKKVMK